MPQKAGRITQFWQELKRRRVIHVITVYASASFVLIELVNNLTEPLNLPPKLATIAIVILAVGFPLAVILAWIYDLTGKGIEKTLPAEKQTGEESAEVPNAWRIATFVSFVVIVGLLTFNIIGGTTVLRAGDIQSMVILPFENFTGDDQLDYFVEGMHASLIGDVGQLGGLQVKSRTSSVAFKDMDMTIPEIASELKADAALETAVMCLGDTICLQFRLVRTTGDEEQLWVGDYKEEKSQILNLYNRITKQIAEQVLVELSSDEEILLAESKTVNTDAYDAYLKAQYHWNQLSEEGIQLAWDYFQRAIDLDPNWADPYAGMAITWMTVGYFGLIPMTMAIPKINFYLEDALKLDPNSAYAHYVKAVYTVWADWDWENGEKEFLRSLKLNPDNAHCRLYYAHFLFGQRRHEEALIQANMGLELDPLDPVTLSLYGVVLLDAGDYQAAIEQLEKAVSINPDFGFGKLQLVRAYRWSGQYDKWIKLWKQITCWDMEHKLAVEKTLNQEGYVAAVNTILSVNEDFGRQGCQMDDKTIIMWLIEAGEYEQAFARMEKLDEDGYLDVPYLASNSSGYEHLESYPGYVAMLKKYKLPNPKN